MFIYTPRQIPSEIFIVGCGGTGSRLVPLITQFMRTITQGKSPRGWIISPTIYLIDDDIVEEKNLMRQNFIQSDVGKHKATVLAQRYSKAYDMKIIPILKRVTAKSDFAIGCVDMGTPTVTGSMVILCVDSAQARRDIITSLARHVNGNRRDIPPFIIDAGNEDDFGQVRFFSLRYMYVWDRAVPDFPKMSPLTREIPFIPYDEKYYANLPESENRLSCDAMDQTLAINALMATLIMGVVQNFYYVKPFNYHQISISLAGGVSTSFNTPRNLYNMMITPEDRGIRNLGHYEGLDLINNFIYETKQALKDMMSVAPVEDKTLGGTNSSIEEEDLPIDIDAEMGPPDELSLSPAEEEILDEIIEDSMSAAEEMAAVTSSWTAIEPITPENNLPSLEAIPSVTQIDNLPPLEPITRNDAPQGVANW